MKGMPRCARTSYGLIMTNNDSARGQGQATAPGRAHGRACAVCPQCCGPLTPTPAASFPPGSDPLTDLEMTIEAQIRAVGWMRGPV
jgi:hypothetical protein